MLYLVLSALIYILSFPNFSLWPLAFFSLIPFFKAIESSENYKILFFKGFIWGLLISTAIGYPVIQALIVQYNKSVIFSILFFLLTIISPFSLLSGLFAITYRFIYSNNSLFYMLQVPGLWIIIEYLKEIIPFFIPWGNINYSITPFNIFIQAADILGPYGITFIIVMINSALFLFLKGIDIEKYLLQLRPENKSSPLRKNIHLIIIEMANSLKKNYKSLSAIMIIFIVFIIYGYTKLDYFDEHLHSSSHENSWIDVKIIQGNFSPQSRWDDLNFFHRFETYLKLTGQSNLHEKNLIIWPETVLNSPDKFDKFLVKKIIKKINSHSNLISGGTRLDSKNRSYNSAYSIWQDGRIDIYDKNILLPYSETSPLGNILGRFYNAPSEFHHGNSGANLLTNFGNAGISICFESLYPRYIRNSVKEGAEFLINLSNDSWFGMSNEPILHHYSAIWRAIENRRFMLRASNSGISSIISPTGKIIVKSELFRKEKLNGKFLPLWGNTFYAFTGDWVLLLSLFFILGRLGFIIFINKNDIN